MSRHLLACVPDIYVPAFSFFSVFDRKLVLLHFCIFRGVFMPCTELIWNV